MGDVIGDLERERLLRIWIAHEDQKLRW